MAKTVAPLLGFGASGAIAKTLVYASWRGVAYARRHVIPANPKSTAQTLTRDIFSNYALRWKQGGTLMRAPWDRFSVGQKFLGRNAYMGKNLEATRGQANLDAYIGSPGAKGGLPPTSMVLTTVAANGLEAVIVGPTPPTGWTLTSAIITAFKEQTPEATVADIIQEIEDTSTPYSCDLTGLDTVEYQVQGWLKWAKPDGSIAYGASISGQIVVT